MAIAFNGAGSISGVQGGQSILSNPTTVEFGPDGRLYVTEQNGTINAFTVEIQSGEYVATAVEEINLVKNIQNHNDDGSLHSPASQSRQVTGLLMSGTDENPVMYVTSSDPRISTDEDVGLDTNSGVLTRLTWTGTEWDAVDLVRGLPRSEENHAVNGMVLSPDGTKLYLSVGGNTNNGAPSSFFANTAEYALSGSILEIDLDAVDALPVQTVSGDGLNDGRKFVYDLPTLDDPNTANNGVREDANGLDTAGPWGGNDGLNQTILPADAPLSVYASGFRNAYDLVMTADGRLYTVDNGSNNNLGGDPVVVNGEATNQINNGGTGGGEPLFLVEQGGYYGHANPTRSNQDQSWTVFDDNGNPDASLSVNTVSDISDLVPTGVDIDDGFLIDPSKFTGDADRLAQDGERIVHPSAESNALVVIGSSSNGLLEYTSDNFDGELQGDLIVAQFNGNVARLNLNEDGTEATYETIPGLSGLALPLDVALGPDGTLWVAEIASGQIKVFAPSDVIVPGNPDTDGDGLVNAIDPFHRDASNGGQAFILPGRELQYDFDANQDGNRPGPGGFGGGLTGVMIDGVTDFDEFFNGEADFPLQNIRLDNVKFTTAAGGGTTVIENAATGLPDGAENGGSYLFHTGATVANTTSAFTVRLETINPFAEIGANGGPSQQIGGYIGTGDQSNFLKLVAVNDGADGQIVFSLENEDATVDTVTIDAPGLLSADNGDSIVFEVRIDRSAQTATPTVTYDLAGGGQNTVTGDAINISGSNVEQVIDGDWLVDGQQTGLATGLFVSNTGQTDNNTFQGIFTDLQIIGEGNAEGTILHRVNAGGVEIAANDGGPVWTANLGPDYGPYMDQQPDPDSRAIGSFQNQRHESLPDHVPTAIIQRERNDGPNDPAWSYSFDVPEPGLYEVRLIIGNHFTGTDEIGDRIFDARVEGVIASAFDNIDPVALFGHRNAGMISEVFEVRDGTLNLEMVHDVVENPLLNGIEIVQLATLEAPLATVSIANPSPSSVQEIANDGATTLIFPVNIDRSPVSPVTVSYQVTVNGVVTEANGSLELGFNDGQIAVDVPNDGVDNGTETVQVVLTGITAGDNGADLGQVSATGTITEDDDGSSGGGTGAVYRVNVGGAELAAADGSSLAWSEDTVGNPSEFLVATSKINQVFNNFGAGAYQPINASNPSISAAAPVGMFRTERFDGGSEPEMAWEFPVAAGFYTVNLFFAELFSGITGAGQRVFDVTVEGTVPAAFDDIDPFGIGGPAGAFMLSHTLEVTDGSLSLEFLHGIENPDVNGIEIISVDDPGSGLETSAFVEVTPDTANFDRSTFNDNSFIIENTGAVKITSVSFDLSTAILPDIVFDPTGAAGDPAARGVRVSDTSDDVGYVEPGNPDADPFSVPHNGAGGDQGFDVVTLDFTDFDPGETVLFGADTDPTTIKGVGFQTEVGSVSGLEMIGSRVTITFEDGTQITSSLFDEGSNGGAQAVVNKSAPPPPTLSFVGVEAPRLVGDEAQTLEVRGTPGAAVTILQVDARLGLPEAGFTPFDLDDFEANMALARSTYTATIGANGIVEVPVTLLRTLDPDTNDEIIGDGGLNHFVAAIAGSNGQTSVTSNVIVVEFDPDFVNTAPTVDPIADVEVTEGAVATFQVQGSDADGDNVTFSVEVRDDADDSLVNPALFAFQDSGNGTAAFSWTTGGDDQGTYTATITASDGLDTSTQTVSLTINDTAAPIVGTNNGETLRGTSDNDVIQALGGSDTLLGLAGDDILEGGEGDDFLVGGLGADFQDGGPGIDRVQYASATTGVRADLQAPGTNTGEAAGDTYANIENIFGSNFNDTLLGNAADNILLGVNGNDSLFGRDGDDALRGQNGDDLLIGGLGADRLIGGAGIDRAQYSQATEGVRADMIFFGTNTGEAAGDIYNSVENLYGSAHRDFLLGTNGANTIWGGAGGNDQLFGKGGNDVLFGLDGNDILFGGTGADRLVGGDGTDRAQYDRSTSGLRVDLGDSSTNTGEAAGDTFVEIENLFGSRFGDELLGDDNGNALFGAAGNDWLNGRAGNDVLFGNAGADTFHYEQGNDEDRVNDFQDDVDTLEIDAALAGGATDGAGLLAAFASQDGADVVFDFGAGDTLTVRNTTVAALEDDIDIV